MTSNTIRSELIRRGIRQADIARALGLSRFTVNNVIRGHRRSRRVEASISDKLGIPLHRIFPVECNPN